MAETLVLIPGLACTARLFEPQIAALSDGRTVLVADHMRDDSIPAIAARFCGKPPSASPSPGSRWADTSPWR